MIALVACSPGDMGSPAENTVPGLGAATAVHMVSLAGWGSQERPVPDTVRIGPGAAVVFQTADFRVHSVEFLDGDMAPAQSSFIRRASHLRSPPLVERGSRYVVLFSGAPPGIYPYRVEGFGEPARGAVVVGTDSP